MHDLIIAAVLALMALLAAFAGWLAGGVHQQRQAEREDAQAIAAENARAQARARAQLVPAAGAPPAATDDLEAAQGWFSALPGLLRGESARQPAPAWSWRAVRWRPWRRVPVGPPAPAVRPADGPLAPLPGPAGQR